MTLKTTKQEAAQRRRVAVMRVTEAWERAPASIRVMAGPYMVPMIAALEALAIEMDCAEVAA